VKVRLYLDEDAMGSRLTRALRSNGLDLVTAYEAGMSEQPDEEHLKYAASQGRVLFSYNIHDYAVLSARFFEQSISHAGIILVEQRSFDLGEQTRRLVRLADTLSAEEMKDRVEFLNSWGE